MLAGILFGVTSVALLAHSLPESPEKALLSETLLLQSLLPDLQADAADMVVAVKSLTESLPNQQHLASTSLSPSDLEREVRFKVPKDWMKTEEPGGGHPEQQEQFQEQQQKEMPETEKIYWKEDGSEALAAGVAGFPSQLGRIVDEAEDRCGFLSVL